MTAQGLFLQSGLQPQMVLTTSQHAAAFHVVSNDQKFHSVSHQNLKVENISEVNVDEVESGFKSTLE